MIPSIRHFSLKALLWIALAALALALPFIVLLAGERAGGTGLLWDFSMGRASSPSRGPTG